MIEKEKILNNTRQGLAIFEYYIPALKENGAKKNFKAVFRDDGDNPDANVFINKKTKIWNYRDFVSGETLNPFDFVMRKEKCDFKNAIEIIVSKIMKTSTMEFTNIPKTEKITDIFITHCDDFKYWEQYINDKKRIRDIATRMNLVSVKEFVYKKNGTTLKRKSNQNSPIFAFKIDDNCYKIYQPMATNKKMKHWWLGNKPDWYKNVFGIDHIPNNTNSVLIVEGYKDAFVANANGICAVAVDNAATSICKLDIEKIKSKCEKIVLCYDNDNAGKNGSSKVSQMYNLPILNLPKEFVGENGKDISDFFKNGNDPALLIDLISALKAEIIDYKESGPIMSSLEQIEKIISDNFQIRYNVVSNTIEYNERHKNDNLFIVLNENNIYRFLQHQNKNISMNKLISLLKSDFVEKFDPFLSYFESLPEWIQDKDSDYIAQLCQYIPVMDEKRFYVQFRKALVRTVACALDPEITNKQALILVHEAQNSGKTTFIRWLCPKALSDYIAENISVDKDSLIALCENFLINMDELATLSKAEINSLKSLLSKNEVKIRRPYDRVPTKTIRRASFFGSTNKAEFLTDETGNVRWLCFELAEKLNWDYKKDINIDDIWRQAYKLYKLGFVFELSQEEIIENEIANQQFVVATPELQILQKYCEPGTAKENTGFYTATEIANLIRTQFIGVMISVQNIGKALKILGFKRESKRTQDREFPIKGYYVKIINESE